MAWRIKRRSTAQGYPVVTDLRPDAAGSRQFIRRTWKKAASTAVVGCVSRCRIDDTTGLGFEAKMEKAINEFRDQHALLLTEIRRLQEEDPDDTKVARKRELKSILKVVARSYLRESVDPEITEDQLTDWLARLQAA